MFSTVKPTFAPLIKDGGGGSVCASRNLQVFGLDEPYEKAIEILKQGGARGAVGSVYSDGFASRAHDLAAAFGDPLDKNADVAVGPRS